MMRWLDRLAARLNDAFRSTAVAASTEPGGRSTVNPAAVKAGLDEIEKDVGEGSETEE
jgi:hypothetical protein